MNGDNRKRNIEVEVETSRSCREEARILARAGRFNGAVSRGYYALYHDARALLLTIGIEAKTHSGVQGQVNLHFIRTGLLPLDVQRTMSRLRTDREDADYAALLIADQTTAESDLDEVDRVCAVLEQHLRAGGWIA